MIEKLINRIGIGTVQFGMDYGVNNKNGKVSKEEVDKILDYAISNKIDTIDTAAGYGESEKVIGRYKELNRFNIISKLPDCEISEIDKFINLSLNSLRLEKVYGFLFHSFETFRRNVDALDKLRAHKEEERIKKIGFSLYYTDDLDYLLERDIKFDLIQVPYNIFDRRFENYFEELKKRNVEIHTRSVYLQGLIFMNANTINNYFDGFKEKLSELGRISQELKISKQEAALNFCLNNEFVSNVIVGFDNLIQIKESINSINSFETVKDNYKVFENLIENDENYLLPFKWKLN